MAESWVADRLEAEGWTLLGRNWRGGGHELDVVVERGDALRFVEVKARGPADPAPEESVGPEKQRRLRLAAEAWLHARGDARDIAFLIAMVTLGADEAPSVVWYDDAF